MSDWIRRKPIYRQSEKEAPFCPDCGQELDWLDMVNSHDECKCGKWIDQIVTLGSKEKGGEYFKPHEPKKPYRLTINGREQP